LDLRNLYKTPCRQILALGEFSSSEINQLLQKLESDPNYSIGLPSASWEACDEQELESDPNYRARVQKHRFSESRPMERMYPNGYTLSIDHVPSNGGTVRRGSAKNSYSR